MLFSYNRVIGSLDHIIGISFLQLLIEFTEEF